MLYFKRFLPRKHFLWPPVPNLHYFQHLDRLSLLFCILYIISASAGVIVRRCTRQGFTSWMHYAAAFSARVSPRCFFKGKVVRFVPKLAEFSYFCFASSKFLRNVCDSGISNSRPSTETTNFKPCNGCTFAHLCSIIMYLTPFLVTFCCLVFSLSLPNFNKIGENFPSVLLFSNNQCVYLCLILQSTLDKKICYGRRL